MKANFKNIIIFMLIIGIVIVGSSFLMEHQQNEDEFTYKELLDLFKNDLVHDFDLDNDTMVLHAYIVENNQLKKNDKGEFDLKEETYKFTYLFQI